MTTSTKPTDYTDAEHPPARLRLYTEDGPAGREWWLDGISADGTRCTEMVWEFDTHAQAVAAIPEFAGWLDLAAVSLDYYDADALNVAAIVHGCGWHITRPGIVTLTGTRDALRALVAAQWDARLAFTGDGGYEVTALDDDRKEAAR